VNKPGNGGRTALTWGYRRCSVKLCSAGTVTGEGQTIWGITSDCFSSQSSQVFAKQNIRPSRVEEREEGENYNISPLSQEP